MIPKVDDESKPFLSVSRGREAGNGGKMQVPFPCCEYAYCVARKNDVVDESVLF